MRRLLHRPGSAFYPKAALLALLALWIALRLLGVAVAGMFWLIKAAVVLAAVAVVVSWLRRSFRK